MYFSASFAFYFQVLYRYFQTNTVISFNIETLSSCIKITIIDLLDKTDVAIVIFKNLLNVAVLEEFLNKTNIEKID